MSARSAVLAKLGAIHADERLYALVAEEASGANELWREIGLLHLRLVGGDPPLAAAEAAAALERLRDGCTGRLAPFRDTLDQAIAAAAAEPWD